MRRVISLLLVIVGAAVLLYPSVSTYLLDRNSSKVISEYDQTMSDMDEERIKNSLKAAEAYNMLLAGEMPEEGVRDDRGRPVTTDSYEDILSIAGDGPLGYISIPKLGEAIPIYHGTDESTMQVGIGHLKGTSLPVGGRSTHAVLTGHRGLPAGNLFTNLDQMKKGDRFFLKVMNRTLCYRVDQIKVVLPDRLSEIEIQKGKDYVTLVTCTPYGINTHRLLVRGERTAFSGKNIPENKARGLKAFWNRLPMQYRHLIIGVGILVLLLLFGKALCRMRLKRQKAVSEE